MSWDWYWHTLTLLTMFMCFMKASDEDLDELKERINKLEEKLK